MKFILKLVLVPFLSYLLGLYLPWWSLALAAAIVCAFLAEPPKRLFHSKKEVLSLSFVASFLGAALFFGIYAGGINSANEGILASRIAELITKQHSSFFPVLMSAIICGITAGLGGMTGGFLGLAIKEILMKRR